MKASSLILAALCCLLAQAAQAQRLFVSQAEFVQQQRLSRRALRQYGYDSNALVGAEEAPSQWVAVDALPPAPAPAPSAGMAFPSVGVHSLSIDGMASPDIPGSPSPAGGYYSPFPPTYSPPPTYAPPATGLRRRLQQQGYGYNSWSVVGAEEAPSQWVSVDMLPFAPAPAPSADIAFPSVGVHSLSIDGMASPDMPGSPSPGGGYVGPSGYSPVLPAYSPPPTYSPPSTGLRRRLQQQGYGYDSWSVVGAEEAPAQWAEMDFAAAAPAPAPAIPFPSVSVQHSLSIGEGVLVGGPQSYTPIPAYYSPPPAYAPAPPPQ